MSALQDTKRCSCQGMTAEADASNCSATTAWASTNAGIAQRTTRGSLRRVFQACATLCFDAKTTDRARNCFSSGKLPTSSHQYRRPLVVFTINRTVIHGFRSPSMDGWDAGVLSQLPLLVQYSFRVLHTRRSAVHRDVIVDVSDTRDIRRGLLNQPKPQRRFT